MQYNNIYTVHLLHKQGNNIGGKIRTRDSLIRDEVGQVVFDKNMNQVDQVLFVENVAQVDQVLFVKNVDQVD